MPTNISSLKFQMGKLSPIHANQITYGTEWGHENAKGGGARNPFGVDFLAAGKVIFLYLLFKISLSHIVYKVYSCTFCMCVLCVGHELLILSNCLRN